MPDWLGWLIVIPLFGAFVWFLLQMNRAGGRRSWGWAAVVTLAMMLGELAIQNAHKVAR
jgi:hypothetical protein